MNTEALYQRDNYLVVDNNNNSNICLVIFSSNGLKIDENNLDNFEYMHICSSNRFKKNVRRIIYVRDIKNRFYMDGINPTINNIPKVIKLLEELTNGLDVYSIGYSSGGYMATICALYLKNVKRVYSMGGVINILDWHGAYYNYNYSDLDFVKNASDEQSHYFNLTDRIKDISVDFYAVYSNVAKADIEITNVLKTIDNPNIHIVELNTKKHGVYFWSYDYKYLFIESNIKKLNKLYKGKTTPLSFSLKNQGLFRFVGNKINQIYRRIKQAAKR